MVSGGHFFKGLDNKIIGFVHIEKFLTKDFLQFEIQIGLHTDLPNKKKVTYHPAAQSKRCLRNDE